MRRLCSAIVLAGVAAAATAQAPSPSPLFATLTIRVDHPGGKINRNLYGDFAEHLSGNGGSGTRATETNQGLRVDLPPKSVVVLAIE